MWVGFYPPPTLEVCLAPFMVVVVSHMDPDLLLPVPDSSLKDILTCWDTCGVGLNSGFFMNSIKQVWAESSQRLPTVRGDEEQALTKVLVSLVPIMHCANEKWWKQCETELNSGDKPQVLPLKGDEVSFIRTVLMGGVHTASLRGLSVSLKHGSTQHSVTQNMQPKILHKVKLKDGKSTKY